MIVDRWAMLRFSRWPICNKFLVLFYLLRNFFFCSISEDDAEIEGGGDAENEEGDEREPEVGGHARRGLGGKSDDGWSLDHEISGSTEELHVLFDALRDVISNQISDPK